MPFPFPHLHDTLWPAISAESFVYLNGQFIPRQDAKLDIEDRGALFADGVYEVLRIYGGRALAMDGHVRRLQRSLEGIRLLDPVRALVPQLPALTDELIRRNQTPDCRVYWQITRGPAPRNHFFPAETKPTVLLMAWPDKPLDPQAPVPRLRAILHPDRRWADCWIKSLMLLPNVLAKQAARDAGADEAIMHHDGFVTEGAATNVLVVHQDVIRTHPTDHAILAGVTRALLLDIAPACGFTVREEPVRVEDLFNAHEVFIAGTTTNASAITAIDNRPIAAGQPGPVTQRLHQEIIKYIRTTCGV